MKRYNYLKNSDHANVHFSRKKFRLSPYEEMHSYLKLLIETFSYFVR